MSHWEALQTDVLLRPNSVYVWQLGKDFDVADNIPTGKVNAIVRGLALVGQDLEHAPIDDVNRFTGLAGGEKNFPLVHVSHP